MDKNDPINSPSQGRKFEIMGSLAGRVYARERTGTMADQNDRELTFARIYDAPRELVFRAFSQAELISQWWPPKGWAMPVCTLDFRTGGEWRYCIRNAAGEEHWARAVYRQIVPMQQIVFWDEIVDAQGNSIQGLPTKTVTVTFEDLGGRTKMDVLVQLATADDRQKLMEMGFIGGFTQSLNNLERLLVGIKQ